MPPKPEKSPQLEQLNEAFAEWWLRMTDESNTPPDAQQDIKPIAEAAFSAGVLFAVTKLDRAAAGDAYLRYVHEN